MDNDQKFQELIRIIDATTATYNEEKLITGWNSFNLIKQQYLQTNLKSFISEEFYKFIGEELNKAGCKSNVREHVKNILMYPLTNYLPWTNYEVKQEVLNNINIVFSAIWFRFELINGKVYAVPVEKDQNLVNIVYTIMTDYYKDFSSTMRANSETCHITLVNSNIVHDIGTDTIIDFLANYNDCFGITTGLIKSTTSLDWSRFSKCCVIEINSVTINNFIEEFNSKFKTNLKPTPHITFAIKPRSLFETTIL